MGHSLVRKTVLDHSVMYPSIQAQTLHSVYESGETQMRGDRCVFESQLQQKNKKNNGSFKIPRLQP